MNTFRKIALSFALAFASLANVCAEDVKLYLYMNDSSCEVVELSTDPYPVITLSDGMLNIVSQGISINVADIALAQFKPKEGHDTPTGVNDTAVKRYAVRFNGSMFSYSSEETPGHVSVCDLTGKSINADVQRIGTSVTVDLSVCANGIYIVRIGEKSFKLTKK